MDRPAKPPATKTMVVHVKMRCFAYSAAVAILLCPR